MILGVETETRKSTDGRPRDALALLTQRTAEAAERIAAKQTLELSSSRPLFLPRVKASMRAMPNHLARSNLFAPIARGRKALFHNAPLVTRVDAFMTFSGEQLDEPQADVWMQAMYEASFFPLGEPVPIVRKNFLTAIGRGTSRWEYDWLHRAMHALSFAMLTIEVRSGDTLKVQIGTTPKSDAIHLISGFSLDPERDLYVLRIDPRWNTLYETQEWSMIDWTKRMQIRQGQDMAKALQRLVATSNDATHWHQLVLLKRMLAYQSPMRKFRTSLATAWQELERLEIIAGAHIGLSTKRKEQVVWTRL